MGLGCTKHIQVPADHCQHREELGHVWCFQSSGPLCLTQNLIPKTPQQPPFHSGTQQKLSCFSCLSNSSQAGLVLVVGFVLPGMACTPVTIPWCSPSSGESHAGGCSQQYLQLFISWQLI